MLGDVLQMLGVCKTSSPFISGEYKKGNFNVGQSSHDIFFLMVFLIFIFPDTKKREVIGMSL